MAAMCAQPLTRGLRELEGDPVGEDKRALGVVLVHKGRRDAAGKALQIVDRQIPGRRVDGREFSGL